MFPGLKKVILQLGPKLQGQEPDPAGFWKELINYTAANIDAVQADLSPLTNAIQSKVHVEPLLRKKSRVSGSQPSAAARSRAKRLKERIEDVLQLKGLSMPLHLEKSMMLISTTHNGRHFWLEPRVGAACDEDTNVICALYNRVTSSRDDAELYHKFGSVAFHRLVLTMAKESNYRRITGARLTRIINKIVNLVAIGNKQCSIDRYIRAELTHLYRNGPKWCRWGEALGGLGSFFFNPCQLTTSMFERINSSDLDRIAVHFRSLGIEKLAQKYNAIAEDIVTCVQMGIRPDQTQVEEGPNTNTTADVSATGNGSEIGDSLFSEATQATGNLATPHSSGVWGPSMAGMMQPMKGVPNSPLNFEADSVSYPYPSVGSNLYPLDGHPYPSAFPLNFEADGVAYQYPSVGSNLSSHNGPPYPYVENMASDLQECNRVPYAYPNLPPSASHPYTAQQDICSGNLYTDISICGVNGA